MNKKGWIFLLVIATIYLVAFVKPMGGQSILSNLVGAAPIIGPATEALAGCTFYENFDIASGKCQLNYMWVAIGGFAILLLFVLWRK